MKVTLAPGEIEKELASLIGKLIEQAAKIERYGSALREIAGTEYPYPACSSPCPGHKLHTELRMIAKTAMGEER